MMIKKAALILILGTSNTGTITTPIVSLTRIA